MTVWRWSQLKTETEMPPVHDKDRACLKAQSNSDLEAPCSIAGNVLFQNCISWYCDDYEDFIKWQQRSSKLQRWCLLTRQLSVHSWVSASFMDMMASRFLHSIIIHAEFNAMEWWWQQRHHEWATKLVCYCWQSDWTHEDLIGSQNEPASTVIVTSTLTHGHHWLLTHMDRWYSLLQGSSNEVTTNLSRGHEHWKWHQNWFILKHGLGDTKAHASIVVHASFSSIWLYQKQQSQDKLALSGNQPGAHLQENLTADVVIVRRRNQNKVEQRKNRKTWRKDKQQLLALTIFRKQSYLALLVDGFLAWYEF